MKTLLFDFDGTIADSFDNFLEIVTTLSTKYNLPILPHHELEKLRSEDPKGIIKRLKIPLYKIPFLARDMKQLQQKKIAHIKPFTGLPYVLRELKNRQYVLGIVTSNGKENVELFLTENDLQVFDYIYSDASMFGKDKVLQKFLKKHGLNKDDVIYIGDEIRDIQACQKAGVKIVAVTWGFNTRESLKKHNPDFLIDDPNELVQLMELNRSPVGKHNS